MDTEAVTFTLRSTASGIGVGHIVDFLTNWGSVLGLVFDLLGAVIIVHGIWISREKAMEIELRKQTGLHIKPEGKQDVALYNDKDIAKQRADERLRARNFGVWGLGFLILGFGLQIIGNLPR